MKADRQPSAYFLGCLAGLGLAFWTRGCGGVDSMRRSTPSGEGVGSRFFSSVIAAA